MNDCLCCCIIGLSKAGEIKTGCEIKNLIKNNNIKLWQVAKQLGMRDCEFSRRLREDFNESDTEKVKNAIEVIKGV